MRSERFLIYSGCALAFGASFANTALVIYTGTSVSHLTGDIAKLAIDVSVWTPEMLSEGVRVGVAAASFFGGAALSGLLIHHPVLDLSKPYGRSITGIGVLFFGSFLFIESYPVVSIGLAGFGCGLQNALASHYRGVILRTTHLTGMFTDFGIMLGMRLRGHLIPAWKIIVPLCVILSFLLGGFSSAITHLGGGNPIALVAFGYIGAGIGWSVVKRRLGFSRPTE